MAHYLSPYFAHFLEGFSTLFDMQLLFVLEQNVKAIVWGKAVIQISLCHDQHLKKIWPLYCMLSMSWPVFALFLLAGRKKIIT